MARYSVVVAEDHPVVATQLRALIKRDFDVVAVVADGKALVDAVALLNPDVVVTDISMPRMDGLEAANRVLQHHPLTQVILLTVHNNVDLVRKGLLLGCCGYVLKSSAGEELLPAIHAVLQGGFFLSAELGPPHVLAELIRNCVK